MFTRELDSKLVRNMLDDSSYGLVVTTLAFQAGRSGSDRLLKVLIKISEEKVLSLH
jgi:hypothetical protein